MSTETCVICLTTREDGDDAHVMCESGAHGLCRECFGAHVREESGKAVSELTRRGGDVFCPMASEACGADKCESKPFLPRLIAMVCDDATFEVYDAARTRVAEKKIVEEAEERVARAKAEASAEAGEEERLRSAREHVIEKILNVSCTRCAQAFCDFSGCFALKCSRCNAGICAYCTADVGVDAHGHIAHCPAAKEVLAWQAKGKDGKGKVKKRRLVNAGHPDGTFGDMELFEEAQRRRRLRALAAYSEAWDEKFYDKFLNSLEIELKDLNITRKDVDKARAKKKNPTTPAKKAQRRGGNARGGQSHPVLDMARELQNRMIREQNDIEEMLRQERNERELEEIYFRFDQRQERERAEQERKEERERAEQERKEEQERAERRRQEVERAMHTLLDSKNSMYSMPPMDVHRERIERDRRTLENRETEIAIQRSMEDAKRAPLSGDKLLQRLSRANHQPGPSRKREHSAQAQAQHAQASSARKKTSPRGQTPRGNQARVKVEQTASASRDSKRTQREATEAVVIDLT